MAKEKEQARMSKNEIVKKIAEKAGINQKEAGAALKALIEAIQDALVHDKKVTFIGFGTFMVAKRNARTGINPRTKKKMKIKAKKVAKFKPGKGLKQLIEK
ncbi:MAG: HU family DNA-binding protein [Candidatus Coatesbacteria bacterium]|nr:HU family DNA-binding protein [Candidatus Coatesbacteria bacterium]